MKVKMPRNERLTYWWRRPHTYTCRQRRQRRRQRQRQGGDTGHAVSETRAGMHTQESCDAGVGLGDCLSSLSFPTPTPSIHTLHPPPHRAPPRPPTHHHKGEGRSQELDVDPGCGGHQHPRPQQQHPQEVGGAVAEAALLQALAVLDQEEHVEEKIEACKQGGRWCGVVSEPSQALRGWRPRAGTPPAPAGGQRLPPTHPPTHPGCQSRRSW